MNDKYLNAIYILFWTFLSKKEPLFCVLVPKQGEKTLFGDSEVRF